MGAPFFRTPLYREMNQAIGAAYASNDPAPIVVFRRSHEGEFPKYALTTMQRAVDNLPPIDPFSKYQNIYSLVERKVRLPNGKIEITRRTAVARLRGNQGLAEVLRQVQEQIRRWGPEGDSPDIIEDEEGETEPAADVTFSIEELLWMGKTREA